MATVTFNPSLDGSVRRGTPNTSFSTVRTGAGTSFTDSATTSESPILQDTVNVNEVGRIDRGVIVFDTSSLPDGANITAATLRLYLNSKTDDFGSSAISVVLTTTASNVNLAASDYNIAGWTMTKQATDVNVSALTTAAYNTWTLNATGLSNINKTGLTKLGLVTAYDADNADPGWFINNTATMIWQTVEGANPPILSVTYPSGTGFFALVQ